MEATAAIEADPSHGSPPSSWIATVVGSMTIGLAAVGVALELRNYQGDILGWGD